MQNNSEIKMRNLLDILRVLKIRGKSTKPEIAGIIGLTPVTVHNFINELAAKGIVKDAGSSKSKGGRKATIFKLNEEYGFIIGQNLGRDHICTSAYDFEMKLIYRNKIRYNTDYSQKVIDQIVAEINNALNNAGIEKGKCLGAGVTVPGQVNQEMGVVINTPDLKGWINIPLKETIERLSGLRVFVGNDINCTLLAMKWLSKFDEKIDVTLINIAEGIGMGYMTGGRIFNGRHSYAGEIGHTTLKYDGPLCACGKKGCFEAFASDYAILNRISEQMSKAGDHSEDKALAENGFTIDKAISMAKDGNKVIYGIFEDVCYYIGSAVENVVRFYDPDIIIIHNNWLIHFPELCYLIEDLVFSNCSFINRNNLRINIQGVENTEIYSPAALVTEYLFSSLKENVLLGNY